MKKLQKQSLVYYMLRIAQRWSLFTLGLATITFWVIQISLVAAISVQPATTQVTDYIATNARIQQAVNMQSMIVLQWLVIATAITALLLLLARVRKYEKRLAIDAAVFIVFCLVATVFAQIIVRRFVEQLG